MERFISIIVPNYNRSDLISSCLEAINKSSYNNFEIIVVDDGSTDDSIEVIKKHDCRLLKMKENRGPAAARNTGAEVARGDIILFTDSDVCIKEDTLKLINQAFDEVPDASAVVGLPDKHCVFRNLSSRHFNLRAYFNYINLPDYISHLYTTISAVKRDAFFDVKGFDPTLMVLEDAELGFRLSERGYKIYFSNKFSVFHHKYVSFLTLLRIDLLRTMARVKLMLGRRMLKSVVREKRYITVPITQILSALVAPLVPLTIAGLAFSYYFMAAIALLLILFLGLNYNYLRFVSREEGIWLSFRFYWLLLIDMLIVGTALFLGLVKYIVSNWLR